MNQVEEITQLNEEKIIINTPLRVKASIPLRNIKSFTSDDDMRQKVFSPAGFTLMNTLLSALTDMNIANQNEVLMLRELLSDHDVESNYKYLDGTVLKDCKLLASSSKRSGKKDVEASATLSIAILNDNQSKFAQAIDAYQTYLALCETLGDLNGQAQALNFIAVNYMLLACPSIGSMRRAINMKADTLSKHIQLAILYNEKHLRSANIGGQFISYTNLGLCYQVAGDIITAAKFHQDALRTAIKLQSIPGQSISVGNLGVLALIKNDYQAARTCFEQHLSLVQTLNDKEAEVNAWKLLAEVNSRTALSDVIGNLQEACHISIKEG